MSNAFQIKAGIVCDLIRREDTGKLLFIGVYRENIVPTQFPANLLLSCVGIADASNKGQFEIEFRVLFDGESRKAGRGNMVVEVPGPLMLPISDIRIETLAGPGTLSFQMREIDEEWQTMVNMPVLSHST